MCESCAAQLGIQVGNTCAAAYLQSGVRRFVIVGVADDGATPFVFAAGPGRDDGPSVTAALHLAAETLAASLTAGGTGIEL